MVLITEAYKYINPNPPNPRIPGLQRFTFPLVDPVTSEPKGEIHFIGSTFDDEDPNNPYIANYVTVVTEKGCVMYNYLTLTQTKVPLSTTCTYTAGYPRDTLVQKRVETPGVIYLVYEEN